MLLLECKNLQTLLNKQKTIFKQMNSIQTLLESSNQYKVIADDAKKLSSKWVKSGLLEGIKSENDRNTMAMLLENQAKQLVTEASGTGGTTSQSGGGYNSENWAGVALPLVRRVFGEIAAKEFVSVQPMNLPSGLVFYLDFKYGTGVNPFRTGDSLYSADPNTNVTDFAATQSLYGAGRFGYSINQFSASIANATTASAAWADFNFDDNFSASFGQFKKVLVPLTAATNYDPKGVRAFTFVSGTIAGADIQQAFTVVSANTASFFITGSKVSGSTNTIPAGGILFYDRQPNPDSRGDFEDQANNATTSNGGYPNAQSQTAIAIPEINVQLKSEAIVAKTRKLKAQWTPEFAQDLNAYHSVDAEAELTGILSQYISMEIDLELLDMLITNAFTVDAWSAVNNTAIAVTNNVLPANPVALASAYYNTQGGWFQTLGTKLQKVSNKIHQLTLRGGANFLVMSPTVATIIESIPGFASDGTGEKLEFNFGIQKIGSLNSRYKVYKNPYMTENVILMGYKGSQFLECGAVFAPYVPLIMTPLLYDPNTFTPRKGLMTRYAKKMIRPDYYGKIYVSGLNTI
jgi:hypothetical protein